MKDYIVRATAAGEAVRAFAITSKNMVEEARSRHNTSPVATAALGRLMSAGAMMGSMLKSEQDLLTIQVQGAGELKGITVTADASSYVKGYVVNPEVMLPAKNGKLDVGGSIVPGILRVIKDMGLKEPYVGTVELQTGEIAEDLTYYFAVSEQTPSTVGLGVLMNKDNTVNCAGGFIVQLMPDTPDAVIDQIEENIKTLPSVTDMLSSGMTPEDMLNTVLKGLEVDIKEKSSTGFRCNCSVQRVEKSLISLGRKELQAIVDDGKPIEIKCQFCNEAYNFSLNQVKELMSTLKA